jgi:hypothetical protein
MSAIASAASTFIVGLHRLTLPQTKNVTTLDGSEICNPTLPVVRLVTNFRLFDDSTLSLTADIQAPFNYLVTLISTPSARIALTFSALIVR